MTRATIMCALCIVALYAAVGFAQASAERLDTALRDACAQAAQVDGEGCSR